MKTYIYKLIILNILLIMLFPLWAKSRQLPKRKKINSNKVLLEKADQPAIIIDNRKISLTDAIKKAIANNHDILSGSYDAAMADTAYEEFKKKYALFFEINTGLNYSKYPQSTITETGSSAKKYDISGSINKTLSTGTTISAGLEHNYENIKSNTTPGYEGIPVSYTPAIFVSIQQELLKNFLGCNDSKWLKIKQNQSKIEREIVLQRLSVIVLGVIAEYWDLILKKTDLENMRLQLHETLKVRNIIRKNTVIGLAEKYQLNFYNNLVAIAESNKIKAEQNYRVALRNFLTTINMHENSAIGNTVILSDKKITIDKDNALRIAYKQRADYIAARLALENAQLELGIYNNQELPSLSAQFKASYSGNDRNMYSAYGDSTGMQYPSYDIRLKMTCPLWGDSAQKANRRNAGYKVNQAKIHLDKTKRSVKDDILSKTEQIETSYRIYQKTKTAQTQSRIYYTRMRTSLLRGRLTTQEVKGGLDNWIESRQNEIKALIGYNIAVLEFYVAKNDLFQKFNIDINTYIPGN